MTDILPADGVWTVYVHGWQTVGADSDYTLHSLVVPLISGGSLMLDSSPASAVIGTQWYDFSQLECAGLR